MFKFKKILSAVLAVSMLGANAVSIASANETYAYTEASKAYAFAWTTDYRYVDNVSIKDTENVFGCVTDAAAHTGTHSYLIRHADSNKNWSAIYLKQATDIPAGKYTVSLWTNGGVNGTFNAVQFPGENKLSSFTAGANDGNWVNYTKTITIDSTVSTFMITCNGEAPGIYIDDISVKDENGKEYIDNGSFDENGRIEPEKTDMYEDFKYGWNEQNNVQEDVDTFGCVTDVKAHGGEHAYLLHHGGKAWSAFYLKQNVNMPQGTYKASFWIYGIGGWGGSSTPGTFDWDNGQYNGIRVSGDGVSTGEVKFKDMSKRTVGAWTEYTAKFTLSGTATNFELICNGYTTAMIIDDISITDASGKEYITNGGFEEQEEEEPPVVVPEDTHTYTEEFNDYMYGWYMEYASQNGSSIKDTSERFGCVTDKKAKTGNHSFLLRHTGYSDNEAGGWAWSAVMLKQSTAIPAGEYTLSFSLYGSGGVYDDKKADEFDYEYNQFNEIAGIKIKHANFDSVVTDGEWSKWTKKITLTDTLKTFTLLSNGHTKDLYIDDISLKDADGKEYILNGGFEDEHFTIAKTDAYKDYFDCGWTYQNDVKNDKTETGTYGCVTDMKAKSGEHSFLLHHDGDAWSAYYLKQAVKIPSGTYTVSFWICGVGGTGGSGNTFDYDCSQYNKIRFTGSDMTTVTKRLDDSDVTKIRMGEWTNYSFPVALDGTCTMFYVVSDGYTEALIIDDISIKNANGSEYIKNGGFEQKINTDEFINPVVYATSEGGAFNFTWTNPSKDYDEVNVYFDGEKQTGSIVEDITTAANAFNEFYYSGVQDYSTHTVTLEGKRDGEVKYSEDFSVWTDDLGRALDYAGNQKLNTWKFERKEDAQYGYANTVLSVDYDEKTEGKSSLKLTGNIPKETRECAPNIYQKVSLDKGKKYVLSFDAKLDNVGIMNIVFSAPSIGSMYAVEKPINKGSDYVTSDWKNYKIPLVFESGGESNYDTMQDGEMYDATICIGVMAILGSMNIDNVKLYEVDESDDTYTPLDENENIIKDGDFEFAKYTIENAKFELVDGSTVTAIDTIQSGKIRVTAGLRNNSMGDDFDGMIAVALYNNNKLVGISADEEKREESTVYLPTDTYRTIFTIPEAGEKDNYKIKVFYWNGMTPLAEADCLQ